MDQGRGKQLGTSRERRIHQIELHDQGLTQAEALARVTWAMARDLRRQLRMALFALAASVVANIAMFLWIAI